MAYKLVEFDGRPTLKLSTAKATLPGRKQVWRLSSSDGFVRDVLGTASEDPPQGGESLLRPVMERGRRTWSEPLDESRARCAEERDRLPEASRSLSAQPYEVLVSVELAALRDRVDAQVRQRHGLS
jgi:nicotinate phosphoribosyltransferase